MSKLTCENCIMFTHCRYNLNGNGKPCKHFKDKANVIVPPCKVGTEIFGLFDNDDEQRKEIYEGKVLCYSLDENNLLWARMRYKNGLTYWHTINDFGKTVFLTKKEAEAKLKELNNNAKM